MKVGQVERIRLDPKSFLAETSFRVDPTVKLPSDSSVKITSDGLLGGQYVSVQPGGAADDMKPGAEFQNVQGAVDLFGLINSVIRPPDARARREGGDARPPDAGSRRARGAAGRRGADVRRAWVLGVVAALLGAGLTVAQEVQPPVTPAPPPPDPPPSTAPADLDASAPPEEALPAPRVERAPVAEAAGDTAPPEPPPPLKRPRFASAILQGVDKITAETFRFEAKVGEPVRYKGVVLTVHACETTADDEAARAESFAHLDVVSQPRAPPGRLALAPKTVFSGWMFASSRACTRSRAPPTTCG